MVLLALALFAAACGGGDDSVSSEPVATTAGSTSSSLAPTSTAAPAPSVGSAELTSTVGSGWSQTAIGEGTKPVLALDGGDLPADASGGWESSVVADLTSVQMGFEGARRITSLALDPQGSPVIAYSDTTGVWLARPATDGGTWESESVVTAGSSPLGQLVSLAVDGSGASHLTYFEVTANSPLDGNVVYVTDGG
ncbi:MAG TPA: hypothetical protein ENI86_09695 [Acidimicrobiales bacterium]|nr:hypothetical protein [Acidimicrobiales bacterium]